VIEYIAEELKYNAKASVDDQKWRDWAKKKFQGVWAEVIKI